MSDLERAGAQHAAIAEAIHAALDSPDGELRLLLWKVSMQLASVAQRAMVQHAGRDDGC